MGVYEDGGKAQEATIGNIFVEPEEKVIAEWESKRKAVTQKEITEIIRYIQTPEGKKYVLPLNKEDGR